MLRSLIVISLLLVTAVVVETTHYSFSAAQQNATAQVPGKPVFVVVPPSDSKITWVHDNGHSELRHLPETCGGGGLFFDFDNDGWMDIYLVNSGPSDFFSPKTPIKNALYRNNHDGTFVDVTEKAGVGCGKMGCFGMGAAASDYDGDGWQDLFVANIDQELFSLYQNQKDLTFVDRPGEIGQATRLLSGWGLKYFDYDNDGKTDLFLANGHPDDMIDSYSMQVKYKEPLLLFHQGADGKLHDVSQESGPAFQKDYAARGLAVGDYNNDGALDVLIGVNGGPPVLLKNTAATGNNWLGLKLEGVTSNRDAIGARLVWKTGGKVYQRLKNNGGSYLSSHDPREVLGLGSAAQVDELEVHWPLPSKTVDRLTNLAPNRYIHIREGKGLV